MLKVIKRYFFEICIILLVLAIFITNYVPGTYLIGWDSLQTELNPLLAVKRAFFSVWQEYQSVGLPAGMAHAADLVRAVFLFLVSFVLRADLVRYFFHHLMLLLGGVGAFKLFKYLGFKSDKSVFAFIGAVFYILNLGTVQMFGLPFEPFSIFFASIPWCVLVFLNFAEEESKYKKALVSLIVVNVLATPQFYQQSLFLIYIFVLLMLVLGMLVSGVLSGEKEKFIRFAKRSLYALIIIFTINLFWLLPQIYSIRFSAILTRQAKINQLATDVVINKNIEKGKLKYLARLEYFYYDLKDSHNDYLFLPWKEHFNNKQLYVLSYAPFIFALVGVVLGRKKYDIPLALIFACIFLVFLSGTFPLYYVGSFLRNLSVLSQVFRSPFTKFIFPYTLVLSYFFILGLSIVYKYSLGRVVNESMRTLFLGLFSTLSLCLILLISAPVFEGNMFLRQMKLNVPEQYMELVKYFKDEDKNLRVAFLPDYTFWGWSQNNWGYDGSGFLWYGIEQPIISRTFDVWSTESESYFWELKRTIESDNSEQFKKVLDKYGVDYLVMDRTSKSITPTDMGYQYDRVYEMIKNVPGIFLVTDINDLQVFKVEHKIPTSSFLSLTSDLMNVGFGYELTDFDNAYMDIGTYKTDKRKDFDVIYPFIDFMTQTDRFSRRWVISENQDNFIISTSIKGLNIDDYLLVENTSRVREKVFDGENITYYDLNAEVRVQNESIDVIVKKVLVENIDVENVNIVNCRSNLTDFGKDEVLDGVLEIYSRNRSTGCFSYGRPFLPHWNGYLIKIESENVSGPPLFFYISSNKTKALSKVEENLQTGTKYFSLGNGGYLDDGYTFGFQNISYIGDESINKLKDLEVFLFPYEYLKSIRLVKKSTGIVETRTSNLQNVKKINYSMYYLKDGSAFYSTLILNQAFEDGWVAICGLKICDADHVKINGWANGWEFLGYVPPKVLIVFWPQILEYVGLLICAVKIVVLIKRGKDNT